MSKKHKTCEDICDAIAAEFAWRLHELSAVKTAILAAKDKNIDTCVRQGMLMLYAHWEGFVKIASINFLQFIVDKKFKQSELTDNYKGIMLKKHFKSAQNSHKIKIHISAVNFLIKQKDEYVIFDPKMYIKTDSNLNYELFENILETLGISSAKYCSREKQIDESLLKNRNSIAHGEKCNVSRDEFISLFDDIISLITNFKDDLQNICATEAYKIKPSKV